MAYDTCDDDYKEQISTPVPKQISHATRKISLAQASKDHRTMTGLGSSCGACKFLRRKCTSECVFAPYFCYDQAAAHFAAVHKVFGASNVSKLLLHLPVHNRGDAAITVAYEALARMRDPIYGCVAHIFSLQQQVASLQEEIEILGNLMASLSVGITSGGSSQTVPDPNCEMQFSFQQDATNTQYYQNPESGQQNHSVYTTGNQTFDNQMNVPLPPLHGWEDQNIFANAHPCPLERLLEEMDKEIFMYCSWPYSGNNII